MSSYDWAEGILRCAHHDKSGRLHGHTYRVRAYRPVGGDVMELQEELRIVLRRYDHRGLGANETLGHQLAALIGAAVTGCTRVDVERPLEGIGARWIRDE